MPALRSPDGPLQPLPFARTVLAFGLPSALRQFRQVAIPLDAVPPYWRRLEAIRALIRRHVGHDMPIRRRHDFTLRLPRIRVRKGDHWFVVAAIAGALIIGTILGIRDFQSAVDEAARSQVVETSK